MTDENCLFCKIAAKKISAAVVFEDAYAIGFLDITPRAPGHTLVIPKYHAATLLDLPDEEIRHLFLAVKSSDALLTEKLNPEGMTIGINQGQASGQEVDHLHVHLMPRWHSDKGGSIQSVVHNSSGEEFEMMVKKIIG
jgi:histidine triad (HIT) family protein